MPSIAPTLKYLEHFKVIGFNTRTQNCDEFNEKTAKLPSLWQQFYTSELAYNTAIYGVYSDYKSDANGLYTVTAGVGFENQRAEFGVVNIQAGQYLVFQGFGPMPLTVIETWKNIWDYFSRENKYQRTFITDFEAFKSLNEVAIYIGIKNA